MGHRKIVLVVLTAVLMLGAGVVLGWAWTPFQKGPGMGFREGSPRPWFDELGLSPDQKKEMDQIWGDTHQQMQKLFERRRDLDRQRDDEVMKLLTSDQRAAYKKIADEFHTQRQELDKQRDGLIDNANARSRALLNDSQQKKWDILSKQMHDMHRRRGGEGLSTRESAPPGAPPDGENHSPPG